MVIHSSISQLLLFIPPYLSFYPNLPVLFLQPSQNPNTLFYSSIHLDILSSPVLFSSKPLQSHSQYPNVSFSLSPIPNFTCFIPLYLFYIQTSFVTFLQLSPNPKFSYFIPSTLSISQVIFNSLNLLNYPKLSCFIPTKAILNPPNFHDLFFKQLLPPPSPTQFFIILLLFNITNSLILLLSITIFSCSIAPNLSVSQLLLFYIPPNTLNIPTSSFSILKSFTQYPHFPALILHPSKYSNFCYFIPPTLFIPSHPLNIQTSLVLFLQNLFHSPPHLSNSHVL